MELRYYQEHAVNAGIAALKAGKNGLLVLPTGSGKSLVIAELCKRLTEYQILVITPRIKLLEQNAALIAGTGILSASRGNDTGSHHQVVCGTIQTLIKRDFVEPDLIIIDEAHMIPHDDSEYAALLASYPNALFLGLTATPFKGRQRIYENANTRWTKAYEIGVIELIEKGFLVPPRSFKTHVEIDRENSSNDEITAQILPVAAEKLKQLNRTKTLVFCRDIAHAELAAKLLQAQGEHALLIHSEMSTNEHSAIYREFKERTEHTWLVNCYMLTTGVDLPHVDSIVIIRKISEGGLYIQIIGRGLRIAENKDYCAVLDYGKNANRFGAIDSPEFLKPKKSKGQGAIVAPEKSCQNCDLLMPTHQRICTHCGHEYQLAATIDITSSNKSLLSMDIRQAIIEDIQVTKKDNATYMIKYKFAGGESALRFVSASTKEKLKNQRGMALYRVSNGIAKVISIHKNS